MTVEIDESHPFLLTAERMVLMYVQMTDSEKHELATWERANVTGDGTFATSDWPGWKAVFSRLSH